MIIDTHAHYVPASFIEDAQAQASRFPSVKLTLEEGKARFQFAGNTPTRPMMPLMSDTEKRLAWMKAQGIDKQVAGGWLDMFGYELPAAEGAAWSALFNQHMMVAARAQSQIVPLASVPMQDGAAAADVLKDAMKAGFSGAMIGAQPRGVGGNLDDPGLDPFWQAASDTGAVVLIHPMYACSDARVNDYEMINAVARVTDVTIAVARLLYSGHLLRFPGAKVIVSTGGGALPFMLGRLKRNAAIHPNKWADPAEGFKKLYFDSIVFEPQALRYLIEMVGKDRVMLGSDYPFPIGDLEPMKLIRNTGLDEATVKAICETNAAKMFSIK
jgi:aminocarboxymuconate-semialdehyde decarboxylase